LTPDGNTSFGSF